MIRLSHILVGLLALPLASAPPPDARSLHFQALVVDAHDDTTQRLLDPAFDLGARHTDGALDLPRMREGGLKALFFSIWTPGTLPGPKAREEALRQIEAVKRQVRLHPKDLHLATTAAEVRGAVQAGGIAVLLGLEGGHMIAEDLASLRRFHALGVRYLTLTHGWNTTWADSSTDIPAHDGLTAFGRQVVAEMNRLGMVVDISHASDKTFHDVLAASQAPVIASHSACRALCDVPRNLTDEMIRELAAKGGVIQINFYNLFLSNAYKDAYIADDWALPKELQAKLEARCHGDYACEEMEFLRLVRAAIAAGRLPQVDWTRIVDHIDHAVKLVGPDHVGLGSDFDGAITPAGMEDATGLPRITAELLKRGYAPSDIRKILGENLLRVMAQVEATARRLQARAAADPPPRS